MWAVLAGFPPYSDLGAYLVAGRDKSSGIGFTHQQVSRVQGSRAGFMS